MDRQDRVLIRFIWVMAAVYMLLWASLMPAKAADIDLIIDSINQDVTYKVFHRLEYEMYDYTKPIWHGPHTEVTITDLPDGVPVFFVARAYDSNGNESADSNEVFCPWQDDTIPVPLHAPTLTAQCQK